VHLVAGWWDIGRSMRQLCLRHRQRIEAFAQQLDLTSPRHQVPGKQLMERSAGRSGAPVPHISANVFSGVSMRIRVSSGPNAKFG
jgi:hypothetical protein